MPIAEWDETRCVIDLAGTMAARRGARAERKDSGKPENPGQVSSSRRKASWV